MPGPAAANDEGAKREDAAAAKSVASARRSIEEERSKLKVKYRDLIDLIAKKEEEDEEEEDEQDGEDIFRQVAEKANELFKSVKNADEALLDAKILKSLSRLCRRNAEGFSTNVQTFRASEYADKLVHCMQGRRRRRDEDDEEEQLVTINPRRWIMLGQAVKPVFARAPALNYIFGSFDMEEVVRRERQKATRVKVHDKDLVVTKSTQLTEAVNLENQTEVLVESTLRQLVMAFKRNGKRALGYFHFVVDPHSFGSTVENIFHTSFLVKEGKVRIFIDNKDEGGTGLPMIEPLKKSDLASNPDGSAVDKKQVVINMSMREWEDLKTALGIRQAVITHEDLVGCNEKRMKRTT